MSYVLIVDDDADGSEVVLRSLEREGFVVRCAPNGRDAITHLAGVIPDVVILDMMMPELDGAGFLCVIRSYLRWSSLPIILLTAYPDGPHIDRARQLGVEQIFYKGDYKLADLVSAVKKLAHGGVRALPAKSNGQARPAV